MLTSNLIYTMQFHQLREDSIPTGQLSVYPIASANTDLILTKSEWQTQSQSINLKETL